MQAILITIVILIALYKYITRNNNYWEKRLVPHPKPLPLFGNVFSVFTLRVYAGLFLAKYYNSFRTPYFGLYILNTPVLVIRSPELVKRVLITDFKNFVDRNNLNDEKLDPVASKILFLSKNPEWKYMRSKISSAFSTTKVKGMLPLFHRTAEDMKLYLHKNNNKSYVDSKDLCDRYATDIAASCGFGVDAHCFENENSEFKIIGKKLFSFDYISAFRQTCYLMIPGLAKLLKMQFFENSTRSFLRELVLSSLQLRRKTGIKRNDIIDTIIKIQDNSSSDDLYKFEGDRAVAQAGQFLIAGLDTVSITISHTFYELALNPEIQATVRSTIKVALRQHGEINYEMLQDLKYLDMVIYETLRKYPVVPFINRTCLEDYQVPDTDLVIEKGISVFITTHGLHYDPEYFPDPNRFNPERFSVENKKQLPDLCYIPFGEGPRSCIGERFGFMVVKIGLVHVLSEFEVLKTSNTPPLVSLVKRGFFPYPQNGLPVKFNKKSVLS